MLTIFSFSLSALMNYEFPGTRVFVARVSRQTKTREYKDLEAHFTANLGYSHHQKAVIVDAPIDANIKSNIGEEPRRIMAYVGGIDLTGTYFFPLKIFQNPIV